MEFLLKLLDTLFGDPKPKLGAEVNPEDKRDIHLSSFQSPVSLPQEYYTDISMIPVQDQKLHGSCVGQAEGTVVAYFDYLENKNFDVSRRYLYAKAKKEDGIPNTEGTYPRIVSGIISKIGATTSKLVPEMNDSPYGEYVAVFDTDTILKDAMGRKANYAVVNIEATALKQAIYQNKLMTISIFVDWGAFPTSGKLTAPRSNRISGSHRICLYGWKGDTFYFRNSWGEKWGVKGDGTFNFYDYQNFLIDTLVYTDIPNDILKQAQDAPFTFTKEMKIGMTDFQVKKLQEFLNVSPATGYFGPVTKNAVMSFQISRNLKGDGAVGPLTLFELNRKISKLDLWCEAIKSHEGWFVGSRSYRNNNPGNLKYVGQKRATGKDSGGFCIFATYLDGYQTLKEMLMKAGTKPDNGPYRPEMTLLEFFQVYAPSSDGNQPKVYAEAVAKKIGCKVGDPIGSLVA